MRTISTLGRLVALALIVSTSTPSWAAVYNYRVPLRAVEASTTLPPVEAIPGLTLSTTSMALSAIAGQTSTQALSVQSSGSGPLSISGVSLGDASNGLTLVDGCSGQTLASGSACSLTLNFSPTAAVLGSTSISLATSAGDQVIPVTTTASADSASARLGDLTASAVSAPANGGTGILFSAKVVDQFSNALGAGQLVTWSTTRGNLSRTTSTTTTDGIAQVTLTATSAGAAVVSAQAATGAALTANVAFQADAETAKVSAVSAAQSTMRSDTTPVVITATLVDGNNNAMPAGTPVKWSTSLGTLSAASTLTDTAGQATVQISSTDAGTATVVAKIGNGDAGRAASVYFTAPSVSYMTATPSSVPGNSSTYSFVYAVATYPDGGAYVGPITFSSLNCGVFENSSGTINKTTSNTGSASAYLVSSGACTTSVKATVRGLYSSSVTVTFTTP